jgi:hypothetical protein
MAAKLTTTHKIKSLFIESAFLYRILGNQLQLILKDFSGGKSVVVESGVVYCWLRYVKKNAGLATVTLISAPNPVSQVLW